jgi:ATP-dependent RNA helicase DeaD
MAGPARYVVARREHFPSLRRRILDALNPASDDDVTIVPVPASREAALQLAGGGAPPVILAEAHQVPWLRTIFAPLDSLPLPQLSVLLEERAESLRARLAKIMETANLDRELFQIGPLLEQFDAALVAAAALHLAQQARAAEPAAAAVPPPRGGPTHAKLWVGIGRKDNVRAGDLVGALANEARVPADAIGKIEVRELFSLVEVKSDVAQQAVQGLSGVSVRGRRLAVRMDRGAGAKPPRRV